MKTDITLEATPIQTSPKNLADLREEVGREGNHFAEGAVLSNVVLVTKEQFLK